MNKILVTALLAGLALQLAGCNTISGIGRDIRSAGRAIERSAQ